MKITDDATNNEKSYIYSYEEYLLLVSIFTNEIVTNVAVLYDGSQYEH